MKYLDEYRDKQLAESLLGEIGKLVTQSWKIMEVCGGQTHSLVRNGILDLLPSEITMVHGPGCPVCVTPLHIIDDAIILSERKGTVLCSFGDMLRVPGSSKSLLSAKSTGADVRVVYSPLEVVKMAKENPDLEFVFFAVGFETTAPANALSVIQANELGISNYSILTSHVLVPPAMEAIMSDPENSIDGFLAAGHVCTIMGMDQYYPIASRYKVPITITGFEPIDLLQGIYMTIKQLEEGRHEVENQYSRIVRSHGNIPAIKTLEEVFDVSPRVWRGIGEIPESGYELNSSFVKFDARKKFNLSASHVAENPECIAGQVLKGIKKPMECPNFGTKCTPENPLGAPMVSSEGACAAYYHYSFLAAK